MSANEKVRVVLENVSYPTLLLEVEPYLVPIVLRALQTAKPVAQEWAGGGRIVHETQGSGRLEARFLLDEEPVYSYEEGREKVQAYYADLRRQREEREAAEAAKQAEAEQAA